MPKAHKKPRRYSIDGPVVTRRCENARERLRLSAASAAVPDLGLVPGHPPRLLLAAAAAASRRGDALGCRDGVHGRRGDDLLLRLDHRGRRPPRPQRRRRGAAGDESPRPVLRAAGAVAAAGRRGHVPLLPLPGPRVRVVEALPVLRQVRASLRPSLQVAEYARVGAAGAPSYIRPGGAPGESGGAQTTPGRSGASVPRTTATSSR